MRSLSVSLDSRRMLCDGDEASDGDHEDEAVLEDDVVQDEDEEIQVT